jgi:hypothetical protein
MQLISFDHDSYFYSPDTPYTESQCRRSCDSKSLYALCQCREAYMDDEIHNNVSTPICTLLMARNCTKPLAFNISKEAIPCKEECKVPCNSDIINPVYSFSTLAFDNVCNFH